MENKIDFVIAWVDGNDPEWRKERDCYRHPDAHTDSRDIRYRDWDNLVFFFRSVERFAPWVNMIHFVTYGHLPKWLNTEHPKINIVKHADFIPAEYLPVFNANPIEMNLHRISGLTEQFVYFNDDMLLLKPCKQQDFFVDGLPCDIGVMNAHISDREMGNHIEVADMDIINAHFHKKDVLKKSIKKWFNLKYKRELIRNFCLLPWNEFPGLLHQHIPTSFLKSTFETVWNLEEDALKETCRHRFRNSLDLNQWLFEDWQRCSGQFVPRDANAGRSFAFTEDQAKNEQLFKMIKEQKYKLICLNDMVLDDSFEAVKAKLVETLETVFPEKSSFEKE